MRTSFAFVVLSFSVSQAMAATTPAANSNGDVAVRDVHTYSNPQAVRVEHATLSLDVDFTARRLAGDVWLRVRRIDPAARELILDTRDLDIEFVGLGDQVEHVADMPYSKLKWTLG